VDRLREPLPSNVEGLPDLPPAAAAVLDRGLRVLGLEDLAVDNRRAIVDHLRLLLAWNATVNLTAIRDPVEAVRRHVLDSLAATRLLRDRRIDAFVDIGSGGGYPGLPLAAAVPARRALLVDSVGKKARFLATAATAVGLHGSIEAFGGRAEQLAADERHRGRWPAVVARAVGGLGELAELGLPLLVQGGILIAWKGRDLEPEMAAAAPALARLGGGRPAVVELDPALGLDGHVLVVVTKEGPTPPDYPRDPAVRRRRPI
jgi:16S rRNA (guanine527-N7)-methyltransferase